MILDYFLRFRHFRFHVGIYKVSIYWHLYHNLKKGQRTLNFHIYNTITEKYFEYSYRKHLKTYSVRKINKNEPNMSKA